MNAEQNAPLTDLQKRKPDFTEPELSLELRPHHALCIRFFEGRGYNNDFVNHMNAVLSLLNSENISIKITDGCDCICLKCPNNKSGECAASEKVYQIDERASRAMAIKPGDTLSRRELLNKSDSVISGGKLQDICKDCEWLNLCSSKIKQYPLNI